MFYFSASLLNGQCCESDLFDDCGSGSPNNKKKSKTKEVSCCSIINVLIHGYMYIMQKNMVGGGGGKGNWGEK